MFKIGDEVILTQRLGLVEKGSLGIVTNLFENKNSSSTYLVRFSDRTYSLSILIITEYLVVANTINKLLFC